MILSEPQEQRLPGTVANQFRLYLSKNTSNERKPDINALIEKHPAVVEIIEELGKDEVCGGLKILSKHKINTHGMEKETLQLKAGEKEGAGGKLTAVMDGKDDEDESGEVLMSIAGALPIRRKDEGKSSVTSVDMSHTLPIR